MATARLTRKGTQAHAPLTQLLSFHRAPPNLLTLTTTLNPDGITHKTTPSHPLIHITQMQHSTTTSMTISRLFSRTVATNTETPTPLAHLSTKATSPSTSTWLTNALTKCSNRSRSKKRSFPRATAVSRSRRRRRRTATTTTDTPTTTRFLSATTAIVATTTTRHSARSSTIRRCSPTRSAHVFTRRRGGVSTITILRLVSTTTVAATYNSL